MALALGLGMIRFLVVQHGSTCSERKGSIFNHSDTPNVSYTIDTITDTIRYTTTRHIEPDEELCIFYGRYLWFLPEGADGDAMVRDFAAAEVVDGWASLSMIDISPDAHRVLESNPSEIISEQDLPFTRVKIIPDDVEEEEPSAIRTSACRSNRPVRVSDVFI